MTRIVVAMMSHETNTFSPVVTNLARFSRGGESEINQVPLAGDAAIATFTDTKSCLGGFLSVCRREGAAVIVPVAGNAAPSGPVEDAAYEYMVQAIVDAVHDCDAMLLDLHGAMVTRSFNDGEGELLRRLRHIRPDLPIGVSLDMHANITDLMVANCTLIAGYQTYPHIDMDSTAERVANLLFRHLRGDYAPTMVWANAPMLPHVMLQGTDDEPNKTLQRRAAEIESDGDTLASVFTGFPHADIADAGLSSVVVTNNDTPAAECFRDELLDQAWAGREDFVYQIEPLTESMQHAQARADSPGKGPVVILDHYDNTASGGTMDTTEVLAAVLEAGLRDVAVFGFFDPECVEQMITAGIGADLTLALGGKLPMPQLQEQSRPLQVTGRVKLLSDGKFPATVAMSKGLTMNMGRCGVLQLANDVDVVIVSRHIEPFDPGCFRSLGIEPESRTYLMLKSRVHYRVGFREMAKAVVECAGVGVCTSDYSALTFNNVRRPVFPLDGVNEVTREKFAAASLTDKQSDTKSDTKN